MKNKLYTLVKVPIKYLMENGFDVSPTRQEEFENGFLVDQGDSLLFDQIRRLRGRDSEFISEVILVIAKKNPRQEKGLRHILNEGFTYNGMHYSRFGKSASQGKEGITAFVCDGIFDELYRVTQMDIPVEECVISKYEAQRCLVFSSCTLIEGYMPNIVVIGEYEEVLPHQLIKYVVEREREFVDKETGRKRKYKAREVEEGYKDLALSPFDGCGCHERKFMETVSRQLGLDYDAVGVQVRLPFVKGYSVYVPFREILGEWGVESIMDVYGKEHKVEDIDCIWNTSMFKGHKLFMGKYGNGAWDGYLGTLRKYGFKLGISKYSHHVKNLHRYTRMNFQYLQCLDLWNPKYVSHYGDGDGAPYDILDESNDGKVVKLARYTTDLFEKIINGDKFFTYKFMGIQDTALDLPESKYLEAALVNDTMLKDPAVKQFIYRKLKKAINEAKVGKIYCSGFYHTGVGDMVGYLQYASGMEPVGCMGGGEVYSANFNCGEVASFRSPLVDPSEVNKVKIVRNDVLNRWFGHFKDQDVVMFNMHDISAPQQGGADYDGDIFLLCDDPTIVGSKIEKNIILDIDDKVTAQSKPYTKENLVEYEIMTRDSRIGEITNVATSIENRYTENEDAKRLYSDYSSLLRIYQGKEIDFLKTGFRWNMNRGLRKHLKQLPYFLLYNYPQKMKAYNRIKKYNRGVRSKEDRKRLNAYHSPSPMNELCDYVCTWEKKKILWNNSVNSLLDTKCLIINSDLDLSDSKIGQVCRRYVNRYADIMRERYKAQKSGRDSGKSELGAVIRYMKKSLLEETRIDEELLANYVISVSYNSFSISKAFAWSAYGDYIIKNLKRNSNPQKSVSIIEVPYAVNGSYEYLGKYYRFVEGDAYR